MIKLLAIDMDGTCLNDQKIITGETLRALHDLADAGVQIVPTTGRALTCIPHQLAEDPFFRYIITSNGACVRDLETGQDLFRAEIPCACAEALLRECARIPLGISVHAGHRFILQGKLLKLLGKFSYGRDADQAQEIPSIRKMLAQKHPDIEEIQLFYFSGSARKRLEAVLASHGELIRAYNRVYVELYHRDASKGTALSRLAAHLGLKREEIACIGDADNDFSMFEASGLRFAMGNAVPELAARADVVLPSNNEDGVAEAVRKYLLQEHKKDR